MIKRHWPSVIFIIAVVISLAHSSILTLTPLWKNTGSVIPINPPSINSNHKYHDHSDIHLHDTNEELPSGIAHFSNGDHKFSKGQQRKKNG